MSSGRVLPRRFFARDSRVVAPELLGKVLVRTVEGGPVRAGRIVEVEAYAGADDPGSHAHRGPTPRTTSMFGPAGHAYVYFVYGMHWCVNAVCGPVGTASAVLVRALAPLEGLDEMRSARPAARAARDLCNGPAKLCQALGIDGSFDGTDLVAAAGALRIVDDGTPPPPDPGCSTRVGLRAGEELPWRWYVPGDPHLSRRG